MPSIIRRKNSIAVQFWAPNGKRKTIAAANERHAVELRRHLDELIGAKAHNLRPHTETRHWLAGLSPEMHATLSGCGLIAPRGDGAPLQLGPFIDAYMTRRADVKDSTRKVWGRARAHLLKLFKASRPLHSITTADAREFRRHLLHKEHMAEATTRKMCAFASQFFADAVDRRLIDENPFDHRDIPKAVGKQPIQKYFIDRAAASKILAACPDEQWRLIFALSRYGGLRCPSEHLALKWSDINWPAGRFTVTSSKTEHHEGKASRVVPIFPELRPYLQAVYDLSLPPTLNGSEFVITRYRRSNTNLSTLLRKIIRRAGLEPWPKLFNALRATRATELEGQFESHVVSAWMGHGEEVKRKHYLQVTDDHYRAALALPEAPCRESHQPATPSVSRKNSHRPVSPMRRLEDRGLQLLAPDDDFAAEIAQLPPDAAACAALALPHGTRTDSHGGLSADEMAALPADLRARIQQCLSE